MKVLIDHSSPFLLAHGGFQVQIEETKRALEGLGVTVDYLRWWEAHQTGDVIHFFGRPGEGYVDLAHQKNICIVMSELLTGLGSRSTAAIAAQRIFISLAKKCVPSALLAKMSWQAYSKADRVIALTEWEAGLMRRVFRAPAKRVVVIPNGVSDEFFLTGEAAVDREAYLVCTATITERKRILELSQAAIHAQVPLWVIGKPYAEKDRYAQEFFALAQRHPSTIRYQGAIEDRVKLAEAYREARGFVLLSEQESLSLSALEAAACGCPLLLSDLPWARTVFKDKAVYCPIESLPRTAKVLKEFYDAAPTLQRPPKPLSWVEIAQQLKGLYEDVLSISR